MVINSESHIEICEVVVYGSSPAGIFSAVSAARMGVTCIIIDKDNNIGGLMSSGLNATDIGGGFVINGLSQEFFRRCGNIYNKKLELRPESKIAKKIFCEMLKEAGVKVIQGHVSQLHLKSRKISHITIEDNINISARIFIDATYEGDLLPLSNVSFRLGR